MNVIDTVKIDNLWGNDTSIKFHCDRQFNFLIGQNGTGKTTVINLIAAALTGDFERLEKTEFDRITITFKPSSGSKKPSIEVKKTQHDDTLFYGLSYEFRNSQKEPPTKLNFDAIDTERVFRGLPPRVIRDRLMRDHFLDIKKQLDSFVIVSWLSVHRFNEENRPNEERKTIPAIDQKLASLNNSLVRYFSALARRYSDNIVEFQKKTLISVLTPEKSEALFAFSNSIDVDNEKKALAGIFEVLGVEERHYSQKIKSHFEKFSQAVKAKEQKNGTVTIDQFAAIYSTWRSHSLVQDYEELQKRKAEIFEPRDHFIGVINELLGGRKRIFLSERNELSFETIKNRQITIEELSSGEKQLLIILGEALLQQGKAVVYIADEPELSLHVNWQETLTASIARLNPNAQIVFATHSPDIIGGHSKNIINMEDVLK